MKSVKKSWLVLGAIVAATSLVACSGGADPGPVGTGGNAAQTDTPTAPGSSDPVTIEIWGWNAETGDQIAEAFNQAQNEVVAEYVLQASNTATATNFRNAMEANNNTACLVQGFAPLTTMVVNGWAQDITDVMSGSEELYNEGALASAQINGRYYGLPTGADGQFLIVNQATFDEYGVAVPTTWAEFVEAGLAFKEHGVHVTNLAGEDPSTLINLAQQAGAEWFGIDGDQWLVTFTDEGTLEAADIIQQLIDEDLVSNQTYQDRPALYDYFDSGSMAATTTQWWSLGGLQENLHDTAGDWVATTFPQFDSSGEPVTPGRSTASFVPVDCDHPEAVVKFVDWLTTPEGIEAGRNPETGAIGFPTQIPDPSDYVDAIIPQGFFADDAEAADIIVQAQRDTIGYFEMGPNYDAWFPEMQDQWGKAVAGEITLVEALEAVEMFTASDLESKGISYSVVE